MLTKIIFGVGMTLVGLLCIIFNKPLAVSFIVEELDEGIFKYLKIKQNEKFIKSKKYFMFNRVGLYIVGTIFLITGLAVLTADFWTGFLK